MVETDPDTAEIKVLRYCVVHDCGRLINPMIVDALRHVPPAAHEHLRPVPDELAQMGGVGGQVVLHIGGLVAARERRPKRGKPTLHEMPGEFVLVEEIRRGTAGSEVEVDRTAQRVAADEAGERPHPRARADQNERGGAPGGTETGVLA